MSCLEISPCFSSFSLVISKRKNNNITNKENHDVHIQHQRERLHLIAKIKLYPAIAVDCTFINALLSMSDNKTPGNDGLPAEFYKRFLPLLESQLVQCLNYAFEHGHLSNSQMQAVITLLQKKR